MENSWFAVMKKSRIVFWCFTDKHFNCFYSFKKTFNMALKNKLFSFPFSWKNWRATRLPFSFSEFRKFLKFYCVTSPVYVHRIGKKTRKSMWLKPINLTSSLCKNIVGSHFQNWQLKIINKIIFSNCWTMIFFRKTTRENTKWKLN